MKDVRISGRMARVFILKETPDRLVYIPLKTLHRIDYDRLLEIESLSTKNHVSMLDLMATYKLDNGRNALLQYDKIIQVLQKTLEIGKTVVGDRVQKPGEAAVKLEIQAVVTEASQLPVYTPPTIVQEEVKERKRPGPKPKPKQEA